MTAHSPTYAVTLVAAAPAPTLESVRAELLETAALFGFTDVSVNASHNQYGSTFTAYAHGPARQILRLASLFDCTTLEQVRADSFETLYALDLTGGQL